MKKLVSLFVVCFAIYSTLLAQNLTTTDLIKLCNKTGWESVNQTLSNRGWVYYESDYEYSIKTQEVTWAYELGWGRKAKGWLSILFDEQNRVYQIIYEVYNSQAHKKITNSISAAGFQKTNSNMYSRNITTTYKNANFIFTIGIKNDSDDDDDSYSASTRYQYTLLKKNSLGDMENGLKRLYWFDGTLRTEYTVKNGQLQGTRKEYYSNGQLESIETYKNDKLHGAYKRYSKDGILITDKTYVNGIAQGPFKDVTSDDDFGFVLRARIKMENLMVYSQCKEI